MTANEVISMMAKNKKEALEATNMEWVLKEIEEAAKENRHWAALKLLSQEVEALRDMGYKVTGCYGGYGSRPYTKPYFISWDKVYDNSKKWWQFWK